MRVVLDANIYINSLLSHRGNASVILALWLEESLFDVCISSKILEELYRVIRYPHLRKIHNKTERELDRFLELIQEHANWVKTITHIDIAMDESNNRYIECAVDGGAGYLVTGDKKHLLPISEYQGIKIVSPATFLTLLKLDN